MIREVRDKSWLYLVNDEAMENQREIEESVKEPLHKEVGKYLFFSKDRETLIKLAKKILKKYKLSRAKIPFESKREFVLCIYDSEPKLKFELEQFADEGTVRYRYWKSDRETIMERRNGKL